MTWPAGRWRLLGGDGVAAAEGLATDEALALSQSASDGADTAPTLRLYTYRDHCVLVGRYQNLGAEVDLDACARRGADVNRRPTGGGAIIMGRDQLGVAMAVPAGAGEHPRHVLERFSRGIAAGLATLGIDAVFRGKNDLAVDGRKVAGLGLYQAPGGGMLLHSSVLADLDVEVMLDVLEIPAAKLGATAGQAVAERVTTLSRLTGTRWDGRSLAEVVGRGFEQEFKAVLEPGVLTVEEKATSTRLVRDRYGSPAWWNEQSPRDEAMASAVVRLKAGVMRVFVARSGDTIKSVLLTGDFNVAPQRLVALEESLRWKRFDAATIASAIETCVGADEDFAPVDALVEAVLEAGATVEQAAPRRSGSCYFPEVESPT